MESLKQPMVVPEKLLLGPGPSNAPERVLAAMKNPLLGHLHPEFLQIMDDVKTGLKYAFQTENRYTFAVSGTGHAGMEAAFVNLVEPGDKVLILESGVWGERAADIAGRCGAVVAVAQQQLGVAFSLADVETALDEHSAALVFVTVGESSTGTWQPLDGLGDACRRRGCLLLVDTVASLCAAPFAADRLGVDCVYSATQKSLGAPPGVAPISFGERAVSAARALAAALSDCAFRAKVLNRKTKPQSFYFDMQLLGNYWGCDEGPRRYHHTGPISMVYALREALALLVEEGLEERVARHQRSAQTLYAGLDRLGLQLLVADAKARLPSLTAVKVPDGVDWKAVIARLNSVYKIEIAGGLGPTAGKIWRIGLMGMNSTEANVARLLEALEESLRFCKASL